MRGYRRLAGEGPLVLPRRQAHNQAFFVNHECDRQSFSKKGDSNQNTAGSRRLAGSLYRGFGSIQCCLGVAGDLTFCD